MDHSGLREEWTRVDKIDSTCLLVDEIPYKFVGYTALTQREVA